MNANTVKTATIDRRQLWALLKCYFRLSTRGRVTQSMGRGGKRRSLFFVLGMYVFLGLMNGVMLLTIQLDVFTYTVMLHSMTFFVVGLAITAESGDILFNVNESDVLVHRPIHPRTLLLAKSLNLIAFALLLAAALNLFPTFFGLAARGARMWFPLVHVISITLLCVLCASAVVCTYGLVIKFLDREKFDNFAAWSQVGMSVIFIGGYQVVPRLLQRFENLSFGPYARYLTPLPPAWFAGIDSWIAGDLPFADAVPLVVFGLVFTTGLAYVAIGKLAPSYGEGLTRLSESQSRTAKPTYVRSRSASIRNPILSWWLRDPIERWSFRLAAVYMRRDRDVKLRLYPSLSVFLVFPLISVLDRNRGVFSAFMPLMTIWILGTMPISALETLRMSSHYAAADIFAVAPLSSAAPVFHGVRKAIIYYLLVPSICIAGVLIVYLAQGGRESLLLTMPGLIAIPTLSLVPGVVEEYLPFSRPAARGEQSSRNMVLMFLTMFAMLGVVGVSWLAWSVGYLWTLVAIELVVVGLLHWSFIRAIRNRPLVRTDGDFPSVGRRQLQ
jgi:ABC-2 type transport system permease protein